MASAPCLRSLTRIAGCSTTVARGNAYHSSLGAACRHEYLRKYQLNLIRPDGSIINARASEPLNYFALPTDLKSLSDDERLQMLAARKPKAKKIVKESIDDNFDAGSYMGDFWSASSTTTTEETNPSSAPKAEQKKATAADAKKGEKKD
ncbi:hypothetical protein PMAYCL1PPCAC_19357, partial [Pristionchus mayeri]